MKKFLIILKRNTKLFFKDKGLFFTSLITPLILLVLYATFLSKVYRDSFLTTIPNGAIVPPDDVIDAFVGGQLMSSLLAVSCVTVSFCSNMLMVQDKVSGAHKDFLITPVKRSTLAFGYYISTTISTLIICVIALGACLIYLWIVGWCLSVVDILLLLLDIFILTSFGTALSSVINFFLSSQGQISAVGSIVSSCYGFICGAYMPLSSFSEGLKSAVMFLPGTYGTSLLRNHALSGAFKKMSDYLPESAITAVKDAVDCNLYFFGERVEISVTFMITCLSVLVLIGIYVLLNVLSNRKIQKKG